LEVFGATGAVEGGATCASSSARLDLTLPPGSYAVRVHDAGGTEAGTYTLLYLRLRSEDAVEIGSTAVVQDIAPRGDLDLYRFRLTSRSHVTVRLMRRSGTIQPCLELRAAGADQILVVACDGASSVDLERTLEAGAYLLLLSDVDNNAEGGYEVQLTAVPDGLPSLGGRWICESTDRFNCLLSGSGTESGIVILDITQDGRAASIQVRDSCLQPPTFVGQIDGCRMILDASWRDQCEGSECTTTGSCVIAGCPLLSTQMDCATSYICSDVAGPDECSGVEVLGCVKQ
jgi:hypothetical protein